MFTKMKRVARHIVAGASILSIAAAGVVTLAPRDAAAQQTAQLKRLGIPGTFVRGDTTRERWDELVTGGYVNLQGHYIVAYSTANARLEITDATHPPTWSAVVAAAGVTLETAHTAGATITIAGTESALTINNTTTNGTGNLVATASGIVAGAVSQSVLSVTQSAANTTTGTVRLADFNFSGTVAAGTPEGLQVTMPANTNTALDVVTGAVVLQNGALTLTSGALTMTSGDLTMTAGDLVLSAGELTLTNAVDEDVIEVTANTVATQQVATLTFNGLTTGDGLLLVTTDAGLTTGNYLRINDGSDVFVIEDEGATTIAGSASGTDALTLTNGDILVSSGNVDLTSGNLTMTAGDLLMSAGMLTVTPTNTGTVGITIVGAGVRTANLVDIDQTGNWTADQFDVVASGAWTANWLDADVAGAWTGNFIDVTSGAGASTGNMIDLNFGAAAHTGDAINVALGSTCTTCQAAVIASGVAGRTTNLVTITDESTGLSSALYIDKRGASGADAVLIEEGGAGNTFNSRFLEIAAGNAAITAGNLYLTTGTRAFTTAAFQIDSTSGAAAEPFIEVNPNTAGAATTDNDVLQVNVGAVDYRGYGLDVKLGATATLAGAVEVTAGAAARTVDLFTVDDDGSDAGDVFSVLKSAGTGNILDLEFDGAATSNAIDVVMGSNVAGQGIVMTTASTAGENGQGLSITHTGASASAGAVASVVFLTSTGAWDADATNATYVLNVDQNTAAGAAGDRAVRISASGANVEALFVDNGTSQFDEAITLGVAGAPVAGTTFLIEAAPGTAALQIDARTAGQLPTQTNGVIDINTSSATANVTSINVDHLITANVDGQVAGQFAISSAGTSIVSTNTVAAIVASLTGNNNAAETGVFTGVVVSAASFNAATEVVGVGVDGTHDFTLATEDTPMVVMPRNVGGTTGATALFGAGIGLGAGGDGGAATFRGGEGAVAAGVADGGAATFRGGDAAGTGVGGAVVLRSGAGAGGSADGALTLGVGGTTDTMVVTDTTTAGGFSGINNVVMAGAARPDRVRWVELGSMTAITGAAPGVFGQVGTRDFLDAALNEVAFSIPIASDIDATGDITLGIVWTSEAGADATAAVWDVEVSCVADGEQTDTAFTSDGAVADTLTLSDEQEIVEFALEDATYAFTAGDVCRVSVQRQGADAGDTVGATVELLGVYYRYQSLTP